MNFDPSAAVRDPFALQRADRLAFLKTPAAMPGGSLPLIRGADRSFAAGHRGAATETAAGLGVEREAAAAARVGEVAPVPGTIDATSVQHSSGLIGVDLASMTPDQLYELMMACAAQMMRATVHTPDPFTP